VHPIIAATSMNGAPWAAIVPIIVLAALFAGYCLADVIRHPNTRQLPAWVWAVFCVISVPFGGIAYLLFGRSEDR
jgi:hypothetical protein